MTALKKQLNTKYTKGHEINPFRFPCACTAPQAHVCTSCPLALCSLRVVFEVFFH
jgi:hypothetical protein